jgi:hypothetical protein
MEIIDYIPKHKCDLEKIDELSKKKYPKYKSILPDLFEWIQDMNWPVAQKIVPLLINAGKDVIPIVKNILVSSDDIWKYWTLSFVIDKMNNDIIGLLTDDLIRIIKNPTDGEKLEEVNIIAKKLLNKIS